MIGSVACRRSRFMHVRVVLLALLLSSFGALAAEPAFPEDMVAATTYR